MSAGDIQLASVSQRALELFSKNIFKHLVIQSKISVHLFQLPVFLLEFLVLLKLVHFHATILCFPVINGRLRYSMLPGDILNVFPSIKFLENAENLCFGKSLLFHE